MREGFCARWRSLNVVFTPVAICEVGNTFDFRFSLLDRSRPRDLPIDCTEQVFLKLSRFRKIDARQTQNPCYQGAASPPACRRYPFPTPFPERTRRGASLHASTHALTNRSTCLSFFFVQFIIPPSSFPNSEQNLFTNSFTGNPAVLYFITTAIHISLRLLFFFNFSHPEAENEQGD